jgi:uncharacterized membrane protein YeaQ/YmgE (transglycosylase-associated protein family)
MSCRFLFCGVELLLLILPYYLIWEIYFSSQKSILKGIGFKTQLSPSKQQFNTTQHQTEIIMNIIAWTVLGLLSGAIAKAIYPGSQGGGILSTIILGIIGAFLGGTLYSLISTGGVQLTATSLSIPGLAISVLGAMLAIYLWGVMARNT